MCPAPQTLFEKAAQLVMVRLGSNLPPGVSAEDDRDRVAALLEGCPVGGLLVFNAHWPGVAHTLNALQGQSRFPLLVASDIERGAGQQVAGATCYPHAMAFGALDEAETAVADFARATAREARACGIHWAFAPVAQRGQPVGRGYREWDSALRARKIHLCVSVSLWSVLAYPSCLGVLVSWW